MTDRYDGRDRPNDDHSEETHGGYVSPEIQTYSPEEFLEVLGPAQGYGMGAQGRERMGWGHRLYPGIR